ncbi:hypothetical protein [Nocardia jejuensis]|uniref:hypothetical protein n=1 Tax=Nocardia jejuensis TaxID=328049 RepID=UPI0009FBF894|nr:hypothetical protein [Nocardia jejuensis]
MYYARSRSSRRFAAAGLLILLMLTLSILPSSRADAATPFDCTGFTCADVTFTGGGGLTLRGTVIGPIGPSSQTPGIVLVGGSGPGPRTEYQYEARAFAAAGITTLVYDKARSATPSAIATSRYSPTTL